MFFFLLAARDMPICGVEIKAEHGNTNRPLRKASVISIKAKGAGGP